MIELSEANTLIKDTSTEFEEMKTRISETEGDTECEFPKKFSMSLLR